MPRPRSRIPEADSNFAANLARARAAMGWSCAKLAERSGVPSSAIFKSEREGRRVTIGEGVAIAAAFGVSLSEMTDPPGEFEAVTLFSRRR